MTASLAAVTTSMRRSSEARTKSRMPTRSAASPARDTPAFSQVRRAMPAMVGDTSWATSIWPRMGSLAPWQWWQAGALGMETR